MPKKTLNQTQAGEIRWLAYQGFHYAAIAEHYGVAESTVSKICKGHLWVGTSPRQPTNTSWQRWPRGKVRSLQVPRWEPV